MTLPPKPGPGVSADLDLIELFGIPLLGNM